MPKNQKDYNKYAKMLDELADLYPEAEDEVQSLQEKLAGLIEAPEDIEDEEVVEEDYEEPIEIDVEDDEAAAIDEELPIAEDEEEIEPEIEEPVRAPIKKKPIVPVKGKKY